MIQFGMLQDQLRLLTSQQTRNFHETLLESLKRGLSSIVSAHESNFNDLIKNNLPAVVRGFTWSFLSLLFVC